MEINILELKNYAGNITVLYVEDDAAIREQIVIFLSKFYPKIDTAKDGAEGLALYENGDYDIVITDIVMPNMNGIEMAKRIKEINPQQTIVVTSAYNEVDNLMELINIGVDKFVMKPISNKPFLILLYNVSKAIYTESQNKKLQEELLEKAEEVHKLLNLLDNQIAVVEDGVITMCNRAFTALFDIRAEDNVELSKLTDKIQNRLWSKTQTYRDIIEFFEQNPFSIHKIKVEDGVDKKLKVFLARHTALIDGRKYILSLTDISDLEQNIQDLSQKLHTNPFTGLPNKEALFQVAGELIKNQREFSTILFSIKNLDRIIAWHGKERAREVEKDVSSYLKDEIENRLNMRKPYIANFDKNFYVVICNKNDTKNLFDFISKIDVSSKMELKDSQSKEEIIHSHMDIFEPKESRFKSVSEYMDVIKKEFEERLIVG